MKTVQDLVDYLNQYFSEEGHYRIDYRDYDNTFEICSENDCGEYDLVEIDSKDRNWLLERDIGYQLSEVQHTIVNFLINSYPDDWFPEKRYNIIVGKDSNAPIYSAYKKPMDNEYIVSSHVFKDEFRNDDELQFTEKDIEDLKDSLPDYLHEIVDLGKVEVKD